MSRIGALALVTAFMVLARFAFDTDVVFADDKSTMTFGFLLLPAYLVGDVISRFKLPKITGFILAGIFFGPHVLGLFSADTVRELKLIDDLALAFIALAATMVAVITLNQIIGPIAFKFALNAVGEARAGPGRQSPSPGE